MTPKPEWLIEHGDCLDVMRAMPDASIDAVVTDPPYGLAFMGKQWDHGVPGVDFWREALRVAKPGAHLLAFGGTRTFHRLVVAIEDAGWEIRDQIAWVYSTGFPKSHNFGCKCSGRAVPYTRERTPAVSEHDLQGMQRADVSAPESAREGRGTILLPRLPEQGVPEHRTTRPEPEAAGREQPGVEGRRHVQARQGKLHRAEVRSMPSGVSADGANGRLRHGASLGHGAIVGAMPDPDGGGSPHRPRHAEQRPVEPGAVRVEQGAQTVRGECPTCGGLLNWSGWGTALKPAMEPICVARKPLVGTVAKNVQRFGTGGLNIDGCRVATTKEERDWMRATSHPNGTVAGNAGGFVGYQHSKGTFNPSDLGRWPANLVLTWPEDEYTLRPDATEEQKRRVQEWLDANTKR